MRQTRCANAAACGGGGALPRDARSCAVVSPPRLRPEGASLAWTDEGDGLGMGVLHIAARLTAGLEGG